MSVSRDSVIINIEGLAHSIEDQMMSHDSLMPPKSCIFKIPNILYRQNEKAFIPNAFSFGPLHHGHPNLKAIEKIKLQYLQCLISRLHTSETDKKRVIDLIKSIEEVEREARQYYAESIEYTPEEFVKILLIDGKATSESILAIELIDGDLKIPPLLIQETTETAFRNLITFEQCYADCETRLTSYAILIDNLINTTKDVDILCDSVIIHSWPNRKDAVQFFNKLYHNTYIKTFYCGSLCKKVNRYCQRRCLDGVQFLCAIISTLLGHFFSTLAATILLILSFLQTLSTMKN